MLKSILTGSLIPSTLLTLPAGKFVRRSAAEREATKTQQQTQQDNEAATAFKETVAAFEEAGDEVYDDFHEVVMGNLRERTTRTAGHVRQHSAK
jgi:hypothetical protein